MEQKKEYILYSGGLKGAESFFGEMAEKYGVKEINFSFEGQKLHRNKNVFLLSENELRRGDISMELVSNMMHRTYYESQKIRKVIQAIFHMVNKGHQVFVVGIIQNDSTVKGGTGWAVELAKLFNRPVSVFDQNENQWFSWKNGSWQKDNPKIAYNTFVGSGTRYLTEEGKGAIENLFKQAFSAS